MPTTIREQVLAAFAARLGAERSIPTRDRDDLPVTGLEAPNESPAGDDYGKSVMDMPVNVVRYVRVPAVTADTDANAALGELIAAALTVAGSPENTLGGLCRNIRYTGGAIDLPPDGSTIAGVAAQFTIQYQFDTGNPFADT